MTNLPRLPLIILTCLVLLEAALEYRAHRRGYETLWFDNSLPADQVLDKTGKEYGPNAEFPFPSEVPSSTKPTNGIRLWIASSSHALYGAPIGQRFPDWICKDLEPLKRPCEVINASSVGVTISTNIDQLDQFAGNFDPDIVLIYQLSLDINQVAKGERPSVSSTNPVLSFRKAHMLYERTTLYGHLRTYISGLVLLQAPMDDSFTSDQRNRIRDRFLGFIRAVRRHDAVPVLSTFAVSHVGDSDAAPLPVRLFTVRYQQDLAPIGWFSEISKLNSIIREVGKSENVLVVDLDSRFSGDPSYFRDFVHFNQNGHRQASKAIAETLMSDAEL